jgi:hypothetical protein
VKNLTPRTLQAPELEATGDELRALLPVSDNYVAAKRRNVVRQRPGADVAVRSLTLSPRNVETLPATDRATRNLVRHRHGTGSRCRRCGLSHRRFPVRRSRK